MVNSLRRMESAAQRGSRQITETTGRGVADFFRAVESPMAGLRRFFEGAVIVTTLRRTTEGLRDLGEQGRRTGAQIEHGMGTATAAASRLAGATRAIGIAGLAAFAAYEVLSKAFQATGNVAQRVFNLGLGGGATGMGIQEFGAIGVAAKQANVDPAQVEGWLTNFSEMQRQVPMGDLAQGNAWMIDFGKKLAGVENTMGVRFGIDQYHDTPEQVWNKLARGFSQMNEQNAYASGNVLFGPGQEATSRWLREAGPNMPGQIAAGRARAPSPAEQEEAQRFIDAQNKLVTAWENLYRHIMLSGLADKLTKLAQILDSLFAPAAPGDTRSWWQRNAPGILGGQSAPGESSGVGTGRGGAGLAPLEFGSVKTTWFGNSPGWGDPLDSGLQASGVPVAGHPGIALPIPKHDPRFGGWYDVTTPDGRKFRLQQTDVGPAATYNGRPIAARLDINSAAASMMGYTPNTFPSGNFTNTPVGDGGIAPLPRVAVASIQRSNAQGATVTHNYGDVNVNGGITVHAPARDAETIGNSVSDKIRQLPPLATPANQGLY